MWKQIYDQQISAAAPETESDCPDKDMFCKILHAAQVTIKNILF
jgi:hypothetical protein